MSTCPDCETGRNLLAGACRSVFQRGLTGGSAGNMSLRVEGGILATPTGIPFGELTPGNLSLLDETGALVSGPKATKEAPFHLAWYKANPDHLAVVHLHSPWAVAVSCLADLDPGSPRLVFAGVDLGPQLLVSLFDAENIVKERLRVLQNLICLRVDLPNHTQKAM